MPGTRAEKEFDSQAIVPFERNVIRRFPARRNAKVRATRTGCHSDGSTRGVFTGIAATVAVADLPLVALVTAGRSARARGTVVHADLRHAVGAFRRCVAACDREADDTNRDRRTDATSERRTRAHLPPHPQRWVAASVTLRTSSNFVYPSMARTVFPSDVLTQPQGPLLQEATEHFGQVTTVVHCEDVS